jgi:thioredoxin 1
MEGIHFLYVYTPLCGTCKVAEKILDVVSELQQGLALTKQNINMYPQLAEAFKIENVPCLLIFKDGELLEKVYAFRSVEYIQTKVIAHL